MTLRPSVVAQYNDNGVPRLLPVSEREVGRAESFYRRVLASDWNLRGRFGLIIGTQGDASFLAPLERMLMSRGVVIVNSEANSWDGARTEATIRRFDVALVAVVSGIVLDAIGNAGFDPVELFQGKIVWASGEGYTRLQSAKGIDLRRWINLGPAVAIEGRHGGGAHVDGREWNIEAEGDTTYVSSRLDRAMSFSRLPVNLSCTINDAPCPGGALGPRIVL
ncbi:hypothetical protein [Sphingomonas paeninsulae]|jgi:hypothetical protein|nr:hypothetical protein [Sphingomonas paeninsulae]